MVNPNLQKTILASDSDSDYSIVRESNGTSLVPSGRQSASATPKILSKRESTITDGQTPMRAGKFSKPKKKSE